MKTKQYVIIIIVIIVCYLFYSEAHRIKSMREENDFKDLMKENYIVKENFLNESEFKVLQEKIANVPLDENPLSYGFKNSYGKVFCFSLFDIGEKLDFYQMEFLEPLIQSILNPNANYFIFNILEITPLTIKDKKWFSNPMSVQMHYDNTITDHVDLNSEKDYLPVCVNVFYLQCPKKTKNGRLVLNDFYNWRNISKIDTKENRMITFKGNLFHGVETMYNMDENDTTKRVSIVLEQYLV
jgi:hypothetical protein